MRNFRKIDDYHFPSVTCKTYLHKQLKTSKRFRPLHRVILSDEVK